MYFPLSLSITDFLCGIISSLLDILLHKNFRCDDEDIYFNYCRLFLTKSLLLVSFLLKKCEIPAKSHNSLRLHQPVKNPISDNSNILWNSL